MWKFVAKRILALIPVLLCVTFLLFVVLSLAPGDPARLILGLEATEEHVEQKREEMGLNDPIGVQYARYINNLLKGDMGTSYKNGVEVSKEISERFPFTLRLALSGICVALIIALPLGIMAAVKQNSFFDSFSMVLALLGISLPTFWLGLLGILLFSVALQWLPSGGVGGIKSAILPVLAMSMSCLAGIARTTRSSMLEVIRSDYIRTARAKGLGYTTVIVRHALRNALIPTLTVVGLQVCTMISATVLVESIFSWPGIGRLLVTSINDRDMPLVLGCIIVFTVCFSIINLTIDLLYGVVDPRIKAQYKK
ncbi:MAG: ABC transporter permease [Bacteroidales bacterium]|nr:ABC transporter permease [Bacteroidales bacterium]